MSYARWSKGDRATAGGTVGWREIGAPAMAAMVQSMLGAPGVIGERQAGAGCGGCLVALVQRPHVDEVTAHVTRACRAAANIEPQVYAAQAAPGAGPLYP